MFDSTALEFRVDLCSNEKPRAAAYQLHCDVAPHLESFLFLALPPDGDVRDEANPKDLWKASIVARQGRAMGLHTHSGILKRVNTVWSQHCKATV